MSQKKRYALVVEDDMGQREMVVVLLENAGFEVLQCDTAETAMIILEEAGRDLALLVSDIHGDMPRSEVAEFARKLFPNIKVIMTRQGAAAGARRRDLPAQAVEAARAHP
jgi:DNA-binding NtrC family response regulator